LVLYALRESPLSCRDLPVHGARGSQAGATDHGRGPLECRRDAPADLDWQAFSV
ncbi:unnamed protein product, partial [Symbiodinium microadriaticum]